MAAGLRPVKLKASTLGMAAAAKARLEAIQRSKFYDLIAAVPLIAWFLFCVAQLLPLLAQQIALAKLIVATDPSVLPASLVLSIASRIGTVIFFVVMAVLFAVRRLPQRIAQGFYPRCAAVAGTFLGISITLLPPQELSPAFYLASLLLITGGTVFAIFAVLALGRSVSIIPEARRLVTSGPYALVRHPLYLGEFVALAGVALQYLPPWAFLLLALQSAFQLQRMKNEERLLCQAFPEYKNYMARTASLVPGVY